MAHSIQVVNGRRASFKDADLLAIECLVEQTIERDETHAHDSLDSVINKWRRSLAGYGAGTIDLELQDLPSEARSVLIALFEAIQNNLTLGQGDIPASVLNERCRAPGVRFNDYPRHLLVEAVRRLQELLVVE